jgi:hypothetical protein
MFLSFPLISKLLLILGVSLLLFKPAFSQDLASGAAGKFLPDKLGSFKAVDALYPPNAFDHSSDNQLGVTSRAARIYASDTGRFLVVLSTSTSDSGAYAQWTEMRRSHASAMTELVNNNEVGTLSFTYSSGKNRYLSFFKGRVSAFIRDDGSRDLGSLKKLAQTLANTIDKGSGELPVLVKHLPDWQNEQAHVLYVVNKEALKTVFSNQPVLDVVSFDGGAEAAVAEYGAQKLVVVEFNTASLATDNDQRIKAKLQELGTQGQPIPTAYRRVGNYAVFVFDAPSAEAANELIDQVKYEQVVQWLGPNPFSYEQATREFTETTLGVFVSVVKTSGLALVSCLAVGGFFGALLFRFRRAQQRSRDAFADPDAMLRLNLDELTTESDSTRLLGRGD